MEIMKTLTLLKYKKYIGNLRHNSLNCTLNYKTQIGINTFVLKSFYIMNSFKILFNYIFLDIQGLLLCMRQLIIINNNN